ncbi:Hypothetical protein SRAE_2000100400 [Strongyloides ratti]|uniref:Kinetochore protein NDC80 homolog n=1 Tax=Strongyloides ratti TaxID=34506 RepID=A0A090MY03_STRRB|nr:Hypothetical protein SRAE_2000100400 [Strongyloides ratti]CEF66334.1 Hypothetical protein SRAE_2000100400 [Strongyloides ratti]
MNKNHSVFGKTIPEKFSISGKQSLTGRPSMVGRVSIGRTSTGRLSLARQSLVGHNRTVPGSQIRRKAGLSSKDIEENSKILREFVFDHNVFDAESAIVSKDFNYATELNFLDYLQIIIYQITDDYQCAKLEKDLNFWLSAFGIDPLQPTMFTNLRNNWKYVVEGLVKLIRVIQCRNDVQKSKEDDDEGISFELWNDANFLELFFTTIENMNGSNKCEPEHYKEGLKIYMDEYVKYTSDIDDDIESLRSRADFLRRKKNDLDEIRAEIEKEKCAVEKMKIDAASLKKYSCDLDENIMKFQELIRQSNENCMKKQEEVENAHKKWIDTVADVTNQRFSKDEAREYSARNVLIASHIQSIEQQNKMLEEEYSTKLAEVSEQLKVVEVASAELISRVQKLDTRIGGEPLFRLNNIKSIDMFGDIDALSQHYDENIYPVVERLIEKIDLMYTKKKEEAVRAEKTLSETIKACQKLCLECDKLEIRNQDLGEKVKADTQKMNEELQNEIDKKEKLIKEIELVENFSSDYKNFGLEDLKNEIIEYKEKSHKFIERKKEKLNFKMSEDNECMKRLEVMKDQINKVLVDNKRILQEI